MSRGTKLQEMEVKTQQSKTVVNANAKPGDPMPTMADPVSYTHLTLPTTHDV